LTLSVLDKRPITLISNGIANLNQTFNKEFYTKTKNRHNTHIRLQEIITTKWND